MTPRAWKARVAMMSSIMDWASSRALRLGADGGAVEQFGVAAVGVRATDLPHREEGVPVDAARNLIQRVVADGDVAELPRPRGRGVRVEVNAERIIARGAQHLVGAVLQVGQVVLRDLLVGLVHLLPEVLARVAEHVGHADHRLARVEHVHRLGVVRQNLDGGVLLGRRGAADHERDGEPLLLHLLRDVHHLVQRGRDEAGEADHVHLVLARGGEDLLAGHHHANVDDLVAVAAEHDADNVLANVVHVALDGGHEDLLRLGLAAGALLQRRALRLHVGDEHRHRLLHHARRLDHLREEHLAAAEEIAHEAHAAHQRPLDDLQRAGVLPARPRLLHVGVDELDNALHQRVRQTLLHRGLAPLVYMLLLLDLAAAGALLGLQLLRVGKDGLGGLRRPVKDGVLHEPQQVWVDVGVDGKGARVDDGHVDRMVGNHVLQEGGVHRHADRLETAEGEAEVGQAAADLGAREVLLDPPGAVHEVDPVVVVLLHAGANGEDVGVEHNVLRGEVVGHEQVVRTLADAHAAIKVGGLALLVEGHDDHGRAIAPDQRRLTQELRFAHLERDGVDERLALRALETRLHHVELGGVDHERHARDLRVGGQHVQEARHGDHAVDEAVVHVDVENHGAVLDLLAGDREAVLPLALLHQPLELQRAAQVAALAHVAEANVLRELERLEAADDHHVALGAFGAWRHALDGLGDGADVVGVRAAAAPHHVEPPVHSELPDVARHGLRRLVVAPHRVGQAGVGVARDVGLAELRQTLNVRLHLAAPERAVQSDRDDVAVAHGGVEGVHRLTAERATGKIGNGTADHDGDARVALVVEEGVEREEGGFCVEAIENGLNKEHIDAAVQQRLGLLRVGRDDLVVGDVAVVGALDGGRDGGRAVQRAQPARHEECGARSPACPLSAASRHSWADARFNRRTRCWAS
ncbi:5-methyltetrahydrofolate--homocysteine methyltransferase [Strigomonas culicis]|uniref:5-methyltetrahydrofolate--homocysteine methyltransferase n=1 Tax=Strigomonas culicis TaxID=28005 RepID=S9TTJ8_9TRYP|nr:5-methyltetrahydrofolate--homocysteine methyltransferase [Strigomonas culicis]|eukprot:EPY19858.1 5-methyltetrahydrofolate--homocysteine methyltransferase [Strigomonas culicis]